MGDAQVDSGSDMFASMSMDSAAPASASSGAASKPAAQGSMFTDLIVENEAVSASAEPQGPPKQQSNTGTAAYERSEFDFVDF